MKANYDLGNGRITQAMYPAEIVKRGDVEYYRVNIGTDKTMYAYQRVDRSDVTMVGKPKREWPTVPRNAPKVTTQPIAPTQDVAELQQELATLRKRLAFEKSQRQGWEQIAGDFMAMYRHAVTMYQKQRISAQRRLSYELELVKAKHNRATTHVRQLKQCNALERQRHLKWKEVAFNGARQHIALLGKPDIVSKAIAPPPANPFRRMQGDVVTAQSNITLPDAVQDRLDAFDEMAKAQGMTALEYMVSVGIDTALDTITNTGKQE